MKNATPAHLGHGKGQQHEACDDGARGDERDRSDVGHRRFLKQEGKAPDGGSNQEQEIGMDTAHERPISRSWPATQSQPREPLCRDVYQSPLAPE